jgi:hypothetical protein
MLDELVASYAGRSVARLVEELLSCYADWRNAAAAAANAYRRWSAAPGDARAQSFCVYTAALDQEEAAAMSYTLAVWDVERWLRHAHS